MTIIIYYGAAFFVFAHGLIHLMGVVVYWQIAEVDDFPPIKPPFSMVAWRSVILGCASTDCHG